MVLAATESLFDYSYWLTEEMIKASSHVHTNDLHQSSSRISLKRKLGIVGLLCIVNRPRRQQITEWKRKETLTKSEVTY